MRTEVKDSRRWTLRRTSVARHYSKHTVVEDFPPPENCEKQRACVSVRVLRGKKRNSPSKQQQTKQAKLRGSCEFRVPQNRIINKEKPCRRQNCFALPTACWHGLNGALSARSSVLIYAISANHKCNNTTQFPVWCQLASRTKRIKLRIHISPAFRVGRQALSWLPGDISKHLMCFVRSDRFQHPLEPVTRNRTHFKLSTGTK